MIKSFKSKVAQDIYDGVPSRFSRKISVELHNKICRLFDQINVVTNVESLRVPPSNRLEKLKGDLKEYWSLRVNNQWRIVFKWVDGCAYEVDVVDYH